MNNSNWANWPLLGPISMFLHVFDTKREVFCMHDLLHISQVRPALFTGLASLAEEASFL